MTQMPTPGSRPVHDSFPFTAEGRAFIVQRCVEDAAAAAMAGRPVRCGEGALARPVVAIGNFDGVHAGHRAVIAECRALAASLGRPAAVLTFAPHPRTYFNPDSPVFRLTPDGVEATLLARLGLDGMIVLPFNAGLAAMSAEAFFDDLLARALGVSGVVVGHDFHFGKGRAGSPDFLRARGAAAGLPVRVTPKVTAEGDGPVSSSRIRAALEAGDVAGANALLGYRWFVRGVVSHGRKVGRTLNYPTANIRLADDSRLAHGVYATRVLVEGRTHDGVASFGRRPMFDNGAPLLEVHLFDFSGDLYGRVIDVEFVAWLRGEETFDSLDALIAQMDADSRNARRVLAEKPPPPSVFPG